MSEATVDERGGGRTIRGRSPEERARQRRADLLAAALELFATQGYANTPIEQICQTAYVGLKAYYDLFETKEQLFIALYEQLNERILAGIAEEGAAGQLRAESSREIIARAVHAIADDRRVGRIMFVEAAGLSPAVEAVRRANHRAIAGILEGAYLAGAFGTPVAEGLNTRRVALGLTGAIVELIVDWMHDQDADGIDDLIDDVDAYCSLVLAGLASRA